jgi:hypothetical protein
MTTANRLAKTPATADDSLCIATESGALNVRGPVTTRADERRLVRAGSPGDRLSRIYKGHGIGLDLTATREPPVVRSLSQVGGRESPVSP